MDKAKILLVEDEFLIRISLSEFLENNGLDVIQADSGNEASMAINTQNFSLLLTDLHLNDQLDGFDLAKMIRKRNKLTPVIFMSGTISYCPYNPDIQSDPVSKNVFITKPYQMGTILEKIKKLLELP